MHACPSVRRQQSKTPKFKFALYIGIPGGGGARVARAVATIPKPVDQPNSKPKFSQISAKSQISVKSRRHGARCHTDACIVADPQITLCRPGSHGTLRKVSNFGDFAQLAVLWAGRRLSRQARLHACMRTNALKATVLASLKCVKPVCEK